MKSKEKVVKAMEEGLQGGFPVVIPYVDIFLRDHWGEVTDEPWWVTRSWDIPAILRVQESLLRKLDLDWVESTLCPSTRWRENHAVRTDGQRVLLVDLFNGSCDEIKRPPLGGEKSTWVDRTVVSSKEDVDAYARIEPHETLIGNGMLDYVQDLAETFSSKFVVAPISTPLWAAYHYLGFRGALTGLFRNPGLVEYLLERLTLSSLETLRAYAKAGVDGVWVEDCLCSANEVSLAHFEKFALPYAKRLLSETRRLGMKSIYYFCGDPWDRLEKLVEAGPDAISLEESKKGFRVDLARVDESVNGRACLLGNLDAINLLSRPSMDELEKEVERQLEVGRRHGKFIMSLGSPVTPSTSISRIREYVDAVRRLGQ